MRPLVSYLLAACLFFGSCGGGSSLSPEPPQPPIAQRLSKPIGFFMNKSWWWTPEYLYDYEAPNSNFDWLSANGNDTWLLEKLKPTRQVILDTGMLIQSTEDGSPWTLQLGAATKLERLFNQMTAEQARTIKAFVIVDEPDIKPIPESVLLEANELLKAKFMARFGYFPKVLVIYSYKAFATTEWKAFNSFDIISFNCYPVAYNDRSSIYQPCGSASSLSVAQMHNLLKAKLLPNQKLALVVETFGSSTELTSKLNENLQAYSAYTAADADQIEFVLAFIWQGIPGYLGAKDMPLLDWRTPFR